jgi:hypothetical protein
MGEGIERGRVKIGEKYALPGAYRNKTYMACTLYIEKGWVKFGLG